MTTRVPIDQIVRGVRDRSDLGNIQELADSIKAVGLLHPVVVTADHTLIAGDRRLVAVESLGWTDIPVTVADLTNVVDLLRAEADENTCRKSLNPVEASIARERRATVLAADAAQRKVEAGKTHGRGQIGSPNLGEPNRKSRETRTAGAVGTGYSPSTLDKVDEVRQAAEKGTATKYGHTIPVPPEVQDVAKASVVDLAARKKNPTRVHEDMDRTLNAFLMSDPEIRRLTLTKSVTSELVRSGHLARLDPAKVGQAVDVDIMGAIELHLTTLTKWVAEVRKHNRGLRLVDRQ